MTLFSDFRKTIPAIPVILCSNPDALEEALKSFSNTVTIEAEYGDRVVEGSYETLAHHGARQINPTPCSRSNYTEAEREQIGAIGLSHIDLDVIGGLLAVFGAKRDASLFWEAAEYIDVAGPRKFPEFLKSVSETYVEGEAEKLQDLVYAFWALSQEHRIVATEVAWDITEELDPLLDGLFEIFEGNPDLIYKGERLLNDTEKLNSESYMDMSPMGVIARVSPSFTNHLYVSPFKEVGFCVVSYNTLQGCVTISFVEDNSRPEDYTAVEIIQGIFQEKDSKGNFLAEGHENIASSPRDIRASFESFVETLDYINRLYENEEANEELEREAATLEDFPVFPSSVLMLSSLSHGAVHDPSPGREEEEYEFIDDDEI